jgi:CRISPR-associated protein Csd1
MILQALRELARRERLVEDPDFTLAPVAWLVTVDRDGRIVGRPADTRAIPEGTTKKKPKAVARSYRIPRQAAGRSGTKAPPAFFVDNAKYVFGQSTADKEFSAEEGREKSGWFRDDIAACVAATGDEGAAAVLRALDDVVAGRQTVTLDPTTASNELFAFIYAPDVDVLVHLRPAVQAYWRSKRQQIASADTAPRFSCVITGEPVGAVENFPKTKNVPGGQSAGTPLVSFNAPAFESYGLKGNENAPISRAAGEAAATALQRLMSPAFPDPRPEHAAAQHLADQRHRRLLLGE